MKKSIVTLLVAILFANNIYSQVQPKIIVIPYTKEGEDIRTVLENDENKRVILSKIKEAFDDRGFSTIDFVARLKAANTGQIMQMDNMRDFKDEIISMSGADVYVEAEMLCQQKPVIGQSKPETRVKINMTAYDVSTGESLSNKIGESGVFYTDDIAKLAMRAVSSVADDFLQTIQAKFSNITENGRSIMLIIGISDASAFTLETEVGNEGLFLQDEIELWISDHTYNGYYHIQGVTSNQMIFDEVRIPLFDNNTGVNYTATRFGLDIFKYFKSLGIPITRDIKGNTIYITIK